MESRIPLPTDNIYKFYAFFGLLLVIFSVGAVLYVSKSTNELAYTNAVEYSVLKADPLRSLPQETRFQLLERQLEIAKQNKKLFDTVLGGFIGIGLVMIFYGFKKWHLEIQPIQDEITRLNLKKLKQEVGEE